MELNKELVLSFLRKHKLMSVATFGKYPWIASVYYTFDKDLNIFFLSSPDTLHCQHIEANPRVAVSIADSSQDINKPKKGLQLYGNAKQISGMEKIRHTLKLWKKSLGSLNHKLSYENMAKKIIKGRMYMIIPKRIKLFDQELFQVEDGQEPVLEL